MIYGGGVVILSELLNRYVGISYDSATSGAGTVNRRKTDNAIAKNKKDKQRSTKHYTRKQKIEQHEPHLKPM
jgi:hypothetical protein